MKKWPLLLAPLLLAACASEPNEGNEAPATEVNETNTNDTTNTNDGEASGDTELLFHASPDAQTLDPHLGNDHATLNVGRTIYDTLVFTDSELNMQMSLAESFEMVEDTLWEVQLREGVEFHDGAAFNAETVKLNIERMLDPEIGSPVAFMFDMIEEVEVIDEYTVHLHTAYPFAPLPSHFAHPAGNMISPDAIEADYAAVEEGEVYGSVIATNPVGTGPFVFESWNPGDNIVVSRNDSYWNTPSELSGITFRVVPEDLTRVSELEAGSAHIISHLNPNDVDRVEALDNAKVIEQPSASLAYFGFNAEVEPFNDPDVRRAIAMAIDKDVIVEGTMNGAALPAVGPLAPPVFGSSDDIEAIPYDPDAARELLEEAGYGDGIEAGLWTDDSRVRLDAAEIIQAQLAEIGVDISIEAMEVGTYLEVVAEGSHELMLGSWGTVTADADYGLYPMFHSSNHGSTGNRTFYTNEEVDQLLEDARSESDEETRLALYHDAQQLIVDDAPIVPLYHSIHLAGALENVDNVAIHPSSLFFLKDVLVGE
ncbi:glutathione ABC transporter substrate-binding protein [Paenalkalicoccus suaedae]|uniref:Glutathione ABC transporter substrate-binding protein n=1 Tax=Paenalkalicoccus suaedae TaxID=2592382 RepID=A0A859FA23_9BACI|nr:glutathione ABC transporter substrate-binding protein [Paenalkalicoccus suaedae]QKS70029.1 glutathione ABC transporter substrate-binding protein [Paenalkalicoccus suaedae]